MAAIAKYLDFADSIDRKLAEGDTRHDFGKSSEDIAVQIKVGSGAAEVKKLDCLRNFGNNIQRIVLFGDTANDKNLSKRLTSSCKGHTVMGGGPEDAFVRYIETKAGIPHTPSKFDPVTITNWNRENPQAAPSRGWDGSNNPEPPAGEYGRGFKKILVRGADVAMLEWPRPAELVAIAADRPLPRQGRDEVRPSINKYNAYHKQVAEALGWTEATGPIPVVVDTTKSLHRSSSPYFIVCRNKETVADPGPSSTMEYEFLAKEDGAAERTHTINNVDHILKGGLADTTVTYRFNNAAPANTQNDFVYDYSGKGISPNSIETCIGKIKSIIDGIISGSEGDPDRYQVPTGSSVAQLIKLFDASCGIYNGLEYTITPTDMRKIALPFIAKRGGDQNQVKSCDLEEDKIINYRIEKLEYTEPAWDGRGRRPVGEITYKPLAGAAATIPINNCVFWTYDRLAAMFAVLNGITTVLQTPTKDIIIYKNDEYDARRVARPPIPNPGPSIFIRGGACTRSDIRRIRTGGPDAAAADRITSAFDNNRKIELDCVYKIIEDLCIPFTPYYDAFTLLNIIYYSYYNKYNGLKLHIDNIIQKGGVQGQVMNWAFTNKVTDRQSIIDKIQTDFAAHVQITRFVSPIRRRKFIANIANYISKLTQEYKRIRGYNIEKFISIYKSYDLELDIDNCIRNNPSISDAIDSGDNRKISDVIATILFNIIQYFTNRGGRREDLSQAIAYKDNVINGIDINTNIDALKSMANIYAPAENANMGGDDNIKLTDILNGINAIDEWRKGGMALPSPPEIQQSASTVENNISKIIAERNIDSNIIFEVNGVVIKYAGGTMIEIFGKQVNITGVGGLIARIDDIDSLKSATYNARYMSTDNAARGGGKSFYETWAELQEIEHDKLDIKQAEQLFLQFIDILGLCEGKYFLNRDLSDNFYTYNIEPVRYGGHTQIEMMAFIDALLKEYYSSKDDESALKLFLMTFLHFPYILDSVGLNGILIDIRAYVNIWFNYENINTGEPSNYKELSEVMKTIIDRASITVTEVQSKMSPDYTECAQYLHTVFPIGHFASEYSVLESIILESNQEESAPIEEEIKPLQRKGRERTNNNGEENTLRATPIKRLLSIPTNVPLRRTIKNAPREKPISRNTTISGYESNTTVINTNRVPSLPNTLPLQNDLVIGGKKRHTKKKGSRRHTIKLNRRKIHTKKRPQKRKTRHAIRKNK